MIRIKKKIVNYFRYGYFRDVSLTEFFDLENKIKQFESTKTEIQIKELLKHWFGNKYNENMVYVLCVAKNITQKFEHYNIELIHANRTFFSWSTYFCVSYILQAYGRFDLAYPYREIAKRMIKKNSIFGRGIVHSITAYIEDGEIEEAERILRLTIGGIILKYIWKREYNECCKYIETFRNNYKIDDAYSEYINNKRIVLLGPAPVEDAYIIKNDIDIVVRFTYRGYKKIPDVEKGIKTDVSYYNSEYTDWLEREIKKQAVQIDDLEWVCIKDRPDNRILGGESRIRQIKWYNLGVTFGNLNMLPIFLMDIMHYNPTEILVYHCNLFTSKKVYARDYSVGYEEKGQDGSFVEIMDVISDDPLGEFNFIKSLYKQTGFIPDKELKEILALNIDEYAKRLTKVFL